MNQAMDLGAQFQSSRYVQINGRLHDFAQPKIMGILNMTPDSFYKESRVPQQDSILAAAQTMIEQGCHILDIGAQSTRPGAELVSAQEEINRIGSIISILKKQFPTALLSIDTFYAEVAQFAAAQGCDIINDISAGQQDPKIWEVAASTKLPYVLTYNRNTTDNLSESKTQFNSILSDALSFLSEKIAALKEMGVVDILIDPGFGFGKTLEENHQLLQQLEHLHILGSPLLIGVSRKSMITKKLGIDATDALNGTTALQTLAYTKGARIFRVHDVAAAQQMIQLLEKE
jgi:dihydropteroate synthase